MSYVHVLRSDVHGSSISDYTVNYLRLCYGLDFVFYIVIVQLCVF